MGEFDRAYTFIYYEDLKSAAEIMHNVRWGPEL